MDHIPEGHERPRPTAATVRLPVAASLSLLNAAREQRRAPATGLRAMGNRIRPKR
jgi:hypothetical protein